MVTTWNVKRRNYNAPKPITAGALATIFLRGLILLRQSSTIAAIDTGNAILSMLSKNLQNILLLLAWESVAHGLKTGKPLRINLDDYPEELKQPSATFIKLTRNQHARGCVGTIEPIRPLGEDVVENAFAAGFCDRHFPPLTSDELDGLGIEITLLSPLEVMPSATQLELTAQLRPHIDGLLLRAGSHHANLLPSAWENFHNSFELVNHLKEMAGLPLTYWSKEIQVYRYTTETFADSSRQPSF